MISVPVSKQAMSKHNDTIIEKISRLLYDTSIDSNRIFHCRIFINVDLFAF